MTSTTQTHTLTGGLKQSNCCTKTPVKPVCTVDPYTPTRKASIRGFLFHTFIIISRIQKSDVDCGLGVAEQTESKPMNGPMTVKQRIRFLELIIQRLTVGFPGKKLFPKPL